jgi:hypothetical protein
MSRGQRKTIIQVEPVSTIQPDDIRIIKTARCPSSSGRSELTYQLGVDPVNTLYIKIHGNSNKGYFNDEWVGIQRILAKLSEQRSSFSSFPLKSLFEGKSINTPHFLMAVLTAEALVVKDGENSRYFSLGDVDGFMARTQSLMEDGVLVSTSMAIKQDRKVKQISKAKAMEITDDEESIQETLPQSD